MENDSYGKHEVIDRLSVIIDNIDRFVLSHAIIQNDIRKREKILKAVIELYNVYNELNIESMEENNG